jgi:hypothetical protein
MNRDDHFTFMAARWNVSEALRTYGDRQPSTADLTLSFHILPSIRIEEQRWPGVDLACPIIIATIADGDDTLPLVIDGWHRVRKAQEEGLTQLPAIILSPDEERSVRVEWL